MISVAQARTLEILELGFCLNTTATFASGERLVRLDLFTNELGKTQTQDKNIILFGELVMKILFFDGHRNIIVLTEKDYNELKKKYTEESENGE